MTFSAPLIEHLNNVYSWHVVVPDDVAQHFLEQEITRLVAVINDDVKIHCALMPRGDGQRYITVNAAIRKKLHLMAGDMIHFSVEEDTSEFGMEMCEEFEVMLEQDDEGRAWFMKLTPGKQRNLIHWVGSVKSSHIRIRRALVAMNHLKAQQGKIEFKLLAQEIKSANQAGL